MSSHQELFSSATKALLESQIASFQALSNKIIEGTEKAIALNIAATKASVEKSIAHAKELSSAKDPQEFFSLTAAQAKPNGENLASYNRHLTDIAAEVRGEFTKTAQAHFTDTKSKITALVDAVTKNAPAGSENVVAILKSAIANASAGYEQLTKTTRQTVETIEAQVVEVTEQFSHNVEEAAPKAAKK